MSSRFSSSVQPLPIGRVAGFRGREGAITVRVASGDASRWRRLGRVLMAREEEDPPGDKTLEFRVQSASAYADRLVLKLHGVDTPTDAQALRGREVLAPPEEVPDLPTGTHYAARLLDRDVVDEHGAPIGRIIDVAGAGGASHLVVAAPSGEVLIPLAKELVLAIPEGGEPVRVRLPQGLLELNRGREEAE